MKLGWVRREPPLATVAVAGSGAVGAELATAAQDRPLRVAAAGGWTLVLGDAADLPWVDGACYLGFDQGLLVPTTRAPTPSAALWRDRLRHGKDDLAVLMPGQALVVRR